MASNIRPVIQQIIELAKAAGSTRIELETLQKALTILSGADPATKIVQYFQEVTKSADVSKDAVLRIVTALENMGQSKATQAETVAMERLGKAIKTTSYNMEELFANARRIRVTPLGGYREVDPRAEKGPTAAELQELAYRKLVRGTKIEVTGLKDLNKDFTDQKLILDSLTKVYAILNAEYEKVGARATGFAGNLRQINDVISGQIVMTNELTKQMERVPFRMKLGGEMLPQETAAKEELIGRLGSPQRLDEFIKKLENMKLKMEHLRSATIEAGSEIASFTFRNKEAGDVVRSATFRFDKFGRALQDTRTSFKTFDQMIARNITKVAEWAISVGLVFGAYRQMQQMFTFMVDIQDAMADMAIVTGESTEAMGRYFDELAAVASATGMEIVDVLRSTDEALRAVGGTDTAQAFDLLGDAAMLAKLGNMELAKSTDVLVASLTQLGMPLTEGVALMDSWVAVSRASKVSISDLAQSFATVSADAEAAGLSVDQLNGVIAAMATTMNLSQQQVANAVRAMTSAITTPSTQKLLLAQGIAVKDLDGNLRDLWDILNDISDLYRAGVIGERELGEVMGGMGGMGARRRAQMVGMMKEFTLAQEMAVVSEEAEGEAQAALAIKTDTLATAIIDLKNATMELGEALGTEGGLLEMLTRMIDATASIVKGIDSLTEFLGPATAAVIAYMAAWALGQKMQLGQLMAGAGVGGMVGGLKGRIAPMVRPGVGGLATGGVYGAAAGLATGLATGSIGQGIGAAAGTAFGYAVMGPLGGMIGSVIGAGFADTISSYIPYLRQELGLDPVPTAGGMAREDILGELEVGLLGPGIVGSITELVMRIHPELKTLSDEDLIRSMAASSIDVIRAMRDPGEGLLERAERYEELIAALDELTAVTEREAEARALGAEGEFPAFVQRAQQLQQAYEPQLEARLKQRRMELPFELISKDIASAREYNKIVDRTYEITNRLLPIIYAEEVALASLGRKLEDTGKEYMTLGMEMVDWSDESIGFIQGLAANVMELEKASDLSAEIASQFMNTLEALRREELATEYGPYPGAKDLGERTQEEVNQIINMARRLQSEAMEQLGIPDEVLDSIDRWALHFITTGEHAWQWQEKLSQQYVDAVIQDLDRLKDAQEETFNVRRLKDVDPSKMQQIAEGNRYWMEYLARLKGMSAQQYMEMEGQQFNLILGPGNVLQQLYSTNEAMLFTLQDIKELEEKQLEGMWNIPSGATFWVPITSMFYQRQEQAGGYPELPELLEPTRETALHTGDTALHTSNIHSGILAMIEILSREGIGTGSIELLLEKYPEMDQNRLLEAVTRFAQIEIEAAQREELADIERRRPPSMEEHEAWRLREIEGRPLIPEREEVVEPTIFENLTTWFMNLFDILSKQPLLLEKELPGGRGGGGLYSMVPPERPIIEQPPIDLTIDVPGTTNNLTNFISVTLDGRLIARQISRYIYKDFKKTYKTTRGAREILR